MADNHNRNTTTLEQLADVIDTPESVEELVNGEPESNEPESSVASLPGVDGSVDNGQSLIGNNNGTSETNGEPEPAHIPTAAEMHLSKLDMLAAQMAKLQAQIESEKATSHVAGLMDSAVDVLNAMLESEYESESLVKLREHVAELDKSQRVDIMFDVSLGQFRYGEIIAAGRTSSPTVRTVGNATTAASGTRSWFLSISKNGIETDIPVKGVSSNHIAEFDRILHVDYNCDAKITMQTKSFETKKKELTNLGFTFQTASV